MSTLTFSNTHIMVAFLEKPTESDGFHEIIDFLNANQIHYALTVNPTLYTSCIKQFWAIAKEKMVNGERQLQALVDKKKVIITETSIRSDLHLKDTGDTDCLPTATIFEELARMGIEDIDKDAEVSLVDEIQRRSDDAEMFDTDALIGNEVFAENDMIEKDQDVIPKEVSTAAPSTTAVSPPVITEVEITLAQTLAKLKSAKSKVVIQEPVQSTATTAPSTIPKAKGITFRDAGESTTRTPTSVSSSSIKDKGKAKMDEPEVPLKKKDQIALDEEMARNLEAQIQAELIEEERLARKKEEEANIALIESWDNTQAMMEADFELAQRLQAEEQGEITIEERSRLFVELMNKRKKHFAKLRAEEKRRKPPTKAQKRNLMSTYLKNMGGYKYNQLKSKSYDEIQKLFDNEMKRVNTFIPMDSEVMKSKEGTEESSKRTEDELESDKSKKAESSEKKAEGSRKKSIGKKRAGKEQKQESSKRQRMEDDKETDEHEEAEEDDEAEMKKHMEVVQDDEEIAIDAIPLATKPPIIVEYKIVKEGQKGFYHLIRADGSSNRYSSMIRMLQNISREDLETLWKLVKTKHGNTRPEDDYEKVFWGDLKVMFEPDIKSEIWRSLQGYKVTVWKLFDSSGVHFVRFKNLHIFMLVEKRYPLTPITITNMLNKKLQADYWNEMCYQLLKLMVKQQKGQ
ncbi:hypothetical protein Tco_0064131 [Tanacetum coccineum]